MNIEHLKKQAKNLRKAWPDLVAAHGGELQLQAAQDIVARLHGYPGWHAVSNSGNASALPSLRESLQAHLAFVPGAPEELPTRYDERRDEWTHYKLGVEVVLRTAGESDERLVDQSTEELDRVFWSVGDAGGDYPSDPRVLEQLLTHARASLAACPFNVETINRIAGVLYSLRRYEEAMAFAEPAASTLLDMVPTEPSLVHVNYGFLSNRPFFRLVHVYLLLLSQARRDKEANALAKRMVRYCPNDNIGFRGLTTAAARRDLR